MEKSKKIEPITEEDLLVYGAYARVAYSLQHSNQIQLTYKGLSMTWIIATYFGVGYTLSSFEVDLPYNPLVIVAVISLASMLVMAIIWYLDLIVEEKKIAVSVYSVLDKK